MPEFNKNNLKNFVTFENYSLAADAVAEGRSMFFLSGHISNWELIAFSYSVLYDTSLKIIAKTQASKGLNKRVNDYRELGGNEIIQTGYSLRSLYDMISRNESICFLIDQSANPDYSVYVNFFGQNTATFSGPAKIALKKRPALLLGYGVREKDYSYKVYFKRINYDDLTQYSDDNVKKLSQRIQTELEDSIRKNPGQWLWLHKRFKHTH